MIIGNNSCPIIKHLSEKQIQGGTLIETPTGNVLYATDTSETPNVNMLLKKVVKKEKKVSIEEEQMVKELEEELILSDTKIQTPLMLKGDVKKTLCSFHHAKKRLMSQLKKMKTNRKFEEMYDEALFAYLDENYAIEKPKEVKPLNFIPHHLVTNLNKKSRLVFACNAKGKRESLNDKLAT